MSNLRIYTGSSWRNEVYDQIVAEIREAGHRVWDFKNPPNGYPGFMWDYIMPGWESKEKSPAEFRDTLLTHPECDKGFSIDFEGMNWANTGVLINSCSKSAHLEAGWLAGKGKPMVALVQPGERPELMYRLLDYICISVGDLLATLAELNFHYTEEPDWPRCPYGSEATGWCKWVRHHEGLCSWQIKSRVPK